MNRTARLIVLGTASLFASGWAMARDDVTSYAPWWVSLRADATTESARPADHPEAESSGAPAGAAFPWWGTSPSRAQIVVGPVAGSSPQGQQSVAAHSASSHAATDTEPVVR